MGTSRRKYPRTDSSINSNIIVAFARHNFMYKHGRRTPIARGVQRERMPRNKTLVFVCSRACWLLLKMKPERIERPIRAAAFHVKVFTAFLCLRSNKCVKKTKVSRPSVAIMRAPFFQSLRGIKIQQCPRKRSNIFAISTRRRKIIARCQSTARRVHFRWER